MSRSCHRATFSRAGLGVGAQHARETGDLLALDRVALVRHRRGALLPARNGSCDLAHLRALEVADLRREPLEPGAGERDRVEQLRVAVARDDLRGDVLAREAQRCRARAARTRGWSPRRSRPRRRSRRRRPGRTRARGAARCDVPRRRTPASLMPNVVGSAWTPCVRPTHSVSTCSRARALSAPTSVKGAGQDHLADGPQLKGERGVEHVGGGQPEVDPAPGLARRRRRARRRTPPDRGRSRARAR